MTEEHLDLAITNKFKNVNDVIEAIIKMSKDKPELVHWRNKMLLYQAIESLSVYITNPAEKNINWENTIVDLQYDVNIDKYLEPIYFNIDEDIIKNKDTFIKEFINTFYHYQDILAFESLCEGTRILIEGDFFNYVIKSENINNIVESIEDQEEKLNKAEELTHYKVDIPFEISGLSIEKSLVSNIKGQFDIEFTPLTIDVTQNRSYYSIIVNLIIEQDLQNLSIEEKNNILKKLLEKIRDKIFNIFNDENSENQENYIEVSFTGKLLIEKSLSSNFVGNDTLQICSNYSFKENKELQRNFIINKAPDHLNDEEKRMLELYAKDGVENYSQIAELMSCSLQTIKNRAKSIQLKLAASSMANATYLYYAE